MLTQYGVLKPDIPRPNGPEQEIHELWRQERREAYFGWVWPPDTNVRFLHNPLWRTQFWSIQCAHDRAHWGWKVVAWLFGIAAGLGYGAAGFLRG